MAIFAEDKSLDSPPPPIHKRPHFASQITLRSLAFVATLAAAWLIISAKEMRVVVGVKATARYNYSSAFKFFAFANVIAIAFSLISLFSAWVIGKRAAQPSLYFYLFLHDLVIGSLLLSGCSAASAIGYVGKYGNKRIGWMAICNQFEKFCSRSTVALGCSYVGFFCYLILTVLSAVKSTQELI